MRGTGEGLEPTPASMSAPVTGEDETTAMSDDDYDPRAEIAARELELERQEILAKMRAKEQLDLELGRCEENEALMSDDDYCPLREEVSKELELEREKILAEHRAEEREQQLRAESARFEEENGLVEASYSDEEAEYWRKLHEYD